MAATTDLRAAGQPPRPRALLVEAPVPHDPRGDRAAFLRLDLNEDLSGPLARVPLPRNGELAAYPTTHALARDLAAHLRLPLEWIRVTAGADEGIFGLLRAYLDPGDTILLPWPTFVEYPVAAGALGGRLERAPYGADLVFPLATFRAALAQGPRVAVLVSPANPTGELIPAATILELAALARGTLLIVDEAYAEYAGCSVLDHGLPPPNVAVLRTFSKAYGLAAARVGYVIAHPDVLYALRQVVPSYSLAGPSLALAQAGLACQERMRRRAQVVRLGQRRIAAWGRIHGLDVQTTAANFVLLRLGDDALAHTLAAALEARGVLVSDRSPALRGTLRATVGAPRHVTTFLRALEQIWREGTG